jgi:site-specific DNA-methyltransferase (adenine-specific)
MTPYYERNGIAIYHGDCRAVLPALTGIDVVLTDPPYGIQGSSGNVNVKRGKGKYQAAFEDTPDYIQSVVVPVVQTLIQRVGCVVVTPGNRNFICYPQPDSFGTFYQPASVGLQVFGNLDAQPIFYYGKNALGRNMGVPCSYVLTEAPEKSIHPCPKPLKIWRLLLSHISRPGQTILDPFMGVGTTLRAAKDLGLRAIGIELDERYCEEAARRLAQDVLPLADTEAA